MSPIPDEVIEQVRDAADLVTLIGEHVELKRTGTDYRGPCPFHGGTHRNFAVIPKKQMFYCFVCHEAGDVFTFFMKHVGMDYPTAVRDVAKRVGIEIPERSTGGPDPREPLFTAVAAAADWYARRLREGDDARAARAYLEGRSFDLEELQPLGLGFAPKGPAFLEAMAALGIKQAMLLESGLAVRREDGSTRPRFWNRLLFPIHDLRGRVVGFGGRLLGDGEPKYLNSPDSPVFHKGELLYRLHEAKHAIRKAERAVLVEGYFDALRLAAAGVEEAVAPLGTAFTTEQAQLIRRYTRDVVLLYDSDAAGLRASFRAADVLLHAGLRVTIATPPPGQDPDSLVVQGGAEAAAAVLGDAMDVVERKLQLLERHGWLGDLSGRRRALDRLLPTLRAVTDQVTRDLYVNRCADALGVSAQAVLHEIESGRWRPPPSPRAVPHPVAPEARSAKAGPERDLLRVAVHEPAWRGQIREHLARLPEDESAERRLLGLLVASEPEVAAAELLDRADEEGRSLLAQLLGERWGALNVDAIVDGALRKLESRTLDARLRAIDRELPVASEEEKIALAMEKERLSRKIAELNPARWNVLSKRRSGSAR